MPRLAWDKERILKTLKQLHRAGKDISYNALARSTQSLVSAAAYHFGSYRKAVEKAGIGYADVTRRPRWTKQLIIQLIKESKRKGEDLHWAAVTRRRDELGKAAFASLQPRLFGRWDKALQAAGLDAGDVSQYRRWDRDSVAAELRERSRERLPLNSGAIQKEDPGLHAAAVRHFGGYDQALRGAKLEPSKVRQRQRWDREEVLRQLRALEKPERPAKPGKFPARPPRAAARDGAKGREKPPGESPRPDTALRREQAALYSAAVRLFGSLNAARESAKKTARAST